MSENLSWKVVPVTSDGNFNEPADTGSTNVKTTGTAGHNSARERKMYCRVPTPTTTITPMGLSAYLADKYVFRAFS